MDITDDTICAIATPLGEGGIGVVRLSGPRALAVGATLVRLRSGASLETLPSQCIRLGDLVLPSGDDAPLDQALITVMRAPRSYTGEDLVELSCHGSPLVLELVCDALIQLGARLADPGEFTRRAFLNGRLDLSQAEAVLDTITAKTAAALRVAQEQLRGRLSRVLEELRERLLTLLGHVEAGIDFVEEDVTFIEQPALLQEIDRISASVRSLADSFREGRILREGLGIAIVGRPNVGKSSLLNALLSRDRAIVTDVPGTTRDVLEETINIRGIPARLLDTAGMRETTDSVEQQGIARSRAALEDADLVLVVLDGSVALTPDDLTVLEQTRTRPRIVVLNKRDLPPGVPAGTLAPHEYSLSPIVALSAKTEDGLDALRDTIRRLAVRPECEPGERPIVTHLRHRTSLWKAVEALGTVRESVAGALSAEFVAVDLRSALEALGEITGTITTDDILDRIFRDFCIGK